ncbi:MAG: c-type cytochrome [Janthinobacterium lividum]
MRWLWKSTGGRVLLALVAVALAVFVVALVIVLPAPLPKLSPEIASRQPDVAHGAYLAVAGDCTACHTQPGGAAFAGGLPLNTPLGAVYATNITSDRQTGIGRYTLPEFFRLMRDGVAADGRRIYPAMPYTAYARVSDADLQDLYGYFLHGVAPVRQANRPSGIPWPLSIRWPIAFWNRAFLDSRPFRADPGQSAASNRGAYLVEGLGHCGTCHTPRGPAFEEKATRNDGLAYLSGAALDGQSPSNLRGDVWTGLGKWTPAEIVELLKTTRTAHTAVAGQMTEVVVNSTQHMRDDDLLAIATYLKSLAPAGDVHAGFTPGNGATLRHFLVGQATEPGARIYMDSCSACHRLDANGVDHAFPSLAGNATVLHKNPDSLVSAILGGARLPSIAGAPSRLAMPAFGWRYSDEEIAALATYVRSAWGNRAPAVTAAEVKRLRPKTNNGTDRR